MIIFKTILPKVFKSSKDVIALVLVLTWCLAIFLPEHFVGSETQESFERLLLMVIGFYFGNHREDFRASDRKEEVKKDEKA